MTPIEEDTAKGVVIESNEEYKEKLRKDYKEQ
jgi:hypothetical protein